MFTFEKLVEKFDYPVTLDGLDVEVRRENRGGRVR